MVFNVLPERQSPRIASDEPNHAVALPGGAWRLWRTAAVRGAGFPASLVLALAAEWAAAAADAYLDAEEEVLRRQTAVLAEIGWPPSIEDRALRAKVRAARRRLVKGGIRAEGTSVAEERLSVARQACASAQAAFAAAYADNRTAISERIQRMLDDDRFCEAAIWQNSDAFGLVSRRLRQPAAADAKHLSAEALVAMWIQRYAVKNDSIGFFGPIGWASLTDEAGIVDLRPGPALVAHREVFFEAWAIDALAHRLDQDAAIKPWISPRVRSGVWTGPDHVYAPRAGAVATTAAERRILELCDGGRTAREIARAVSVDPARDSVADSDAIEILQGLVARDLLTWRLEVPRQLHPECDLAAKLDRIDDPAVRAALMAPVAELRAARDRVAQAAGHPEALSAALAELAATFTRLTGRPATRSPGATYAARSLVYEDCRRDCDLRFGAAFLERLGPPLSIVLDGARWAASELAGAFRSQLLACHADLRAGDGGGEIEAQRFVDRVTAVVAEKRPEVMREIERRYQDRWRHVLRIEADRCARVTRTVAEVVGRAAEAFGTCAPAWSRAAYVSPDVLVATAGLDAFRRGDFHFVLGEVHGTNSLVWSPFISQHPNPQWLLDAMTRDTEGQTTLVREPPKSQLPVRLQSAISSPAAWRYEEGEDPPDPQAGRRLPVAKLVAVDEAGTVRMRARDGSVEFDAVELFGQPLCQSLHELLGRYVPVASRTPRITIGDLTICRERWWPSRDEMSWVDGRDHGKQFVSARAWARKWSMPRHVFYKVPNERKPCFLDFDSPIYVEIFAKLVRKLGPGTRVRIEEMLPTVDQAWLVDGEGTRYTSELRLVARRSNTHS